MSEVLKKIFTAPGGVPVDGLVTGRKATGIWTVTDRMDRILIARSDESWRPGVDWVVVQDGRIVGRAIRREKIQVYKV